MRIVRLTKNVERALLRGRRERDEKAHRVAARIIVDVRKRGDAAIREWTKEFDGVNLRSRMWVSSREIVKARKHVAEETRVAMEHAIRNIRAVAERQLPRGWALEIEPGVEISQVVRPIEAIGCYVPGGRFSLLSTLLMTVLPAQVAGVKRIVVVSPKPNTELLSAAAMLGVTRIARIGGAQ